MYGASIFLLKSIRAFFESLYRIAAGAIHHLDPVIAPVQRVSARVGAFLGRILAPVDRFRIVYPAVATAGLALLVLLLGPNIEFNFFRDEGYLWYGTQRVMAGEIPFRDFQSYYDPARYYLCAAVMAAFGSHGIMALWKALALFGAAAAAIASWLVFRKFSQPSLWMWLVVSVTLILWMFPETYKLLDICASLILVMQLAWLMEQPTRFRCFTAGVIVGLVTIIGRNHGLYGVVADVVALSCVALAERRADLKTVLACGALGVFVGYLPMLLALALVPGLWAPFWDGIRIYFVLGKTNLGVPVPWPWLVEPGQPLADQLRYIAIGSLLIFQPLFSLAVVGRALRSAVVHKTPLDPLLFAPALLALIYTHHAFARPGLEHLAQAIYPLLITIFVLANRRASGAKIALASLVCAVSLFVELPKQPLYMGLMTKSGPTVQIGPDMVSFSPYDTLLVQKLTGLVEKYAPNGQEFVAEPFLPGFYAMFDRRAAVWNSYQLSPATPAEQEMEIKRIQDEHPAFVLIEIQLQDNRRELAYWATSHQVFRYVTRNFNRVDSSNLVPGMMLYVPPGTDNAAHR